MYSNQAISSEYYRQQTSFSSSIIRKDPFNYTLNGSIGSQSMIHKLPGHPEVNLSSNMEVVILFQAAEIERLNSIVNSHRLKNKGINKSQLDRHSYQIQIKELMQICEAAKQENKNLNSYIQKMNAKMRQTIYSQSEKNLASKYERALRQIEKMYSDNTSLQEQINALNRQVKTLKHSEAAQSPLPHFNIDLQLETLRQKLESEHQMKVSKMETKHSEAVAEIRSTFSMEHEKLKKRMLEQNHLQLEELEQELDISKRRLEQLEVKLQIEKEQVKVYEEEIAGYQTKLRREEEYNAQLMDSMRKKIEQEQRIDQKQHRIDQDKSQREQNLENKVALLSQELLRLSQLIKQKNMELEDSNRKLSALQRTMSLKQSDNSYEFTRYREEVERNMSKYHHEVQELEKALMSKNREAREMNEAHALAEQQIMKKERTLNQLSDEISSLKLDLLEMEEQASKHKRNTIKLQEELSSRNEELREYAVKKEQGMRNEQQLQRKVADLQQKLQTMLEKEEKNRRFFANFQQEMKEQMRRLKAKQQENVERERRLISQQSQQYLSRYEQQRRKCEMLQLQLSGLQKTLQASKQNVQQCERKYESKVLAMEKEFSSRSKKNERKFDEKLGEVTRELELKHKQVINRLLKDHENRYNDLERELEDNCHQLRNIIKGKDVRIDQLEDLQKMRLLSDEHSLHRQHEVIVDKIDEVNRQLNRMHEAIMSGSGNSKQGIKQELEFISQQMITLSKQILDLHIGSPQFHSGPSTHVIEDQLNEIMGFLHKKDRQKQEQSEQLRIHSSHQSKQYQAQIQALSQQTRELELQIEKIQQQSRQTADNKQHFIRQMKQSRERQILDLEERYNSELRSVEQRKNKEVAELVDEIAQKSAIIKDYEANVSVVNLQIEQLETLMLSLQMKSNEIEHLKAVVGEYQSKYEYAKEKLQKMSEQIESIIYAMGRDENYIRELEQDRKRIMQEVEQQKQQRIKVILNSRKQISRIYQQLTQQTGLEQQVDSEDASSAHLKMLSLQKQFDQLERLVIQLKNENYQLQRHNYEEETHEHVYREFTNTKIRQLNREIDRLAAENLDLKDEVCRCRMELAEEFAHEKRRQQNLSTMVLLMVEVEALRKRVR